MKKIHNEKFMEILKRSQLNQKEFAQKTTQVWKDISGRTLSENAVTNWVQGRTVPKLSPNEHAAVLSILDCTLFEWASAFRAVEQAKKDRKRFKK